MPSSKQAEKKVGRKKEYVILECSMFEKNRKSALSMQLKLAVRSYIRSLIVMVWLAAPI